VVEPIHYRRSRFTTQLPTDRRYTPSHCWLLEEAPGIWRVGFTQLATWLLGDPVEFAFTAGPGTRIVPAQEIGWVEGLKALHTIHSVAEGEFLDAGSEIAADITLIGSDPYQRGWLYRVRGNPDPAAVDVQGYLTQLDQAVDAVIRGRESECGGECDG
jgi:glycine cleavage system H protein